MVCFSLAVRNPKITDNIHALSIIYDSDNQQAVNTGNRNLETAAKIAASAHVDLKKISRYDINIASGIIHTVKEHNITSLIIGLRRDSDIKSYVIGNLATNLLRSLYCEIMVMRLMVPINTLGRIIIAVPPKAEYEPGFRKWVEHFGRLGNSLERRLDFFATDSTIAVLQPLMMDEFKSTEATFQRIDSFDSLPSLISQTGSDSLLAVISARQGSISYDSSFERLPKMLGKDLIKSSLILLYPEKYDESGHSLN